MNALFALFVLLSIGDAWTTYIALHTGKAHEVNGFGAWLMKRLGVVGALIAMKGSIILLAFWGLSAGVVPLWFWLVADAAMAWVVWHNWRVYQRAKGAST